MHCSVPQITHVYTPDIFDSGLRITNEFSYGSIILSNSSERAPAYTVLPRSGVKFDHAKSNEDYSEGQWDLWHVGAVSQLLTGQLSRGQVSLVG